MTRPYELGVLGGMGPLATDVFYRFLIDHTVAHSDQEHINTLILSHASLPDRTEIIRSGRGAEFLEAVAGDFDIFNAQPLKAIAIPCNTSHYFYRELQAMTEIPIINMVEETVKLAAEEGARKLVVLATEGTRSTGVYEGYAEKYGLEVLPLEEGHDREVMEIIYRVKAENVTRVPRLNELIDHYEGRGRVVLACTELSSIDIGGREVLDALKVLGIRAIEHCGRSYNGTNF
ncbi:MAG: amino acid racemase [Tissierellia bacterium]|nr:amino acid racemase [Tissierellia bacterium]